MSDLHSLPKDAPVDPKAARVSAEQAGMLVNALVRDDGPRPLKVHWSSGVKGPHGAEYIQCSSQWSLSHYYFWFRFTGGIVTNLLLMKTPKGSEYNLNDGGDPFDEVTIDDRIKLTHLMLGLEDTEDWGCELIPAWVLSIDGKQPFHTGIFYDEVRAKEALAEQRIYREKIVTTNATRNRDDAQEEANKQKTKKKTK